MNKNFGLNRRNFVATIAALGLPSAYAATPWPTKPIRIVVPFTTGGSLDVMARAIGVQLSTAVGKPVIVDNKAGAGGAIGTVEVAKAAPDGHTLVLGTLGTHVINPLVMKSLNYDPVRDFTPISLVQAVPMLVAVNSGLGVNTFGEFIALAKSKPGEISIASAGNAHLLTITRLSQLTGVKLKIVPYRGPAQSIVDAIGGHVDAVLETGTAVLPAVRAGSLKILAVGSRKRLEMFESTPTVIESGVPDFESVGVNALYAPAGLPKEIQQKLSSEVRKIVSTPAIASLILSNAGIVVNSTPEELASWQARQTQISRETIEKNNLKFE